MEERGSQEVWVSSFIVKCIFTLPCLLVNQEVMEPLHQELIIIDSKPLGNMALDILCNALYGHSDGHGPGQGGGLGEEQGGRRQNGFPLAILQPPRLEGAEEAFAAEDHVRMQNDLFLSLDLVAQEQGFLELLLVAAVLQVQVVQVTEKVGEGGEVVIMTTDGAHFESVSI